MPGDGSFFAGDPRSARFVAGGLPEAEALFGSPLPLLSPAEFESGRPAFFVHHLHAVGLSKYDMPEFFIALEALPLTASGKVLKRELQEWVRIGRIAPQPVRWRETAKES